MKRVAAWTAGAIVVLLAGVFVSIFGLDVYEPSFGRAYTLRLSLIIGLVLAAIGVVTYAIISRFYHSNASIVQAVIAGALFQLALFAFVAGAKWLLPGLDNVITAGVAAIVLGAMSSFLGDRHVA